MSIARRKKYRGQARAGFFYRRGKKRPFADISAGPAVPKQAKNKHRAKNSKWGGPTADAVGPPVNEK